MLIIGITGGIGSGKSVVSNILESLGYPVFNSDNVSKDIVNTNPEIRAGLTAFFGTELYKEGVLDRVRLAEIIFTDDSAREKVNALIHPQVRDAFDTFARKSGSELVFNEAAILFETGAYKRMDKMVLVTAPEELRIKRVMQRDGSSEEEVRARMSKQWTDAQKIPLADFILNNDEKEPLLSQVETMLSSLNI